MITDQVYHDGRVVRYSELLDVLASLGVRPTCFVGAAVVVPDVVQVLVEHADFTGPIPLLYEAVCP